MSKTTIISSKRPNAKTVVVHKINLEPHLYSLFTKVITKCIDANWDSIHLAKTSSLNANIKQMFIYVPSKL